jgi:hypothetical protein
VVVLSLLATAALAFASPLGLVDLGARHWLPLAGAVAGGLGAAIALAHSSRVAAGLGLLMLGLCVGTFFAGGADLRIRHAAGDATSPDRWRVADPDFSSDLLRTCRVLRDGSDGGPGVGPFSGAEILEMHRAYTTGDLGPGGCLVVEADDAWVIRGDARSDRLDRARILLHLRPVLHEERLLWFTRLP